MDLLVLKAAGLWKSKTLLRKVSNVESGETKGLDGYWIPTRHRNRKPKAVKIGYFIQALREPQW